MIAKDKLQHLVMGAGAVFAALATIWISQHSLGAACAFLSTLLGVFYEVQQWYRREGQPDLLDAVATAAPGWLAWLVLEAMK